VSTRLIQFALMVLAGLITSLPPAIAGRRELEQLLDSPTRPTVSQVIQATGRAIDGKNPYRNYLQHERAHEARMAQIPALAQTIAFMEKAFPGAIWAPLGRDAVVFGDLLDAFYHSISQSGRVSRLNASGTSFGEGDWMRLDLLVSAGLDLKQVDSTRPLIGMDRTSFGPSSQSTNLMRAGYSAYAWKGYNPKNLIHHLNFLALGSNFPDENSGDRITTYFENVAIQAPPCLSEIMSINIGEWTDSIPWHETFGPLQTALDGTIAGTPGAPSALEDRKAVLGELIEIIQRVRDPRFLVSVQKKARALGYEFETTTDYLEMIEARKKSDRQLRISESKISLKEIKKDFAETTSKLSRLPRQQDTRVLSNNAQTMYTWLEHATPKDDIQNLEWAEKTQAITLFFISEISQLRRERKIDKGDHLLLLEVALSRALDADWITGSLSKGLIQIYRQDPLLQRTLSEYLKEVSSYSLAEQMANKDAVSIFSKVRRIVTPPPVDECAEAFSEPRGKAS
jgi:hypothetical protein